MCCEKTCGHTHTRGVRCQNKKTSFLFCFWSRSKPCRESLHQCSRVCYQCVDTGRDMFLAPPHESRQGRSTRDSYIDASANRGLAELPSYVLNARPFVAQDPPAPSRPQGPSGTTPRRPVHQLKRSNARSSRSQAERSRARSPPPQGPSRGESLRHPVPVSPQRSALLTPTWTPPPSCVRSPSIAPSSVPQRGRSLTTRHRSTRNGSVDSLVSAVSAGPFDERSVSPDELGRRVSYFSRTEEIDAHGARYSTYSRKRASIGKATGKSLGEYANLSDS